MASSASFHHLSCLLFSLLLILPPFSGAQANGNITLGSSLSIGANSWLSPSGDFAFGFHRVKPDDDLFVLAIWFNKIVSERTIVWYANGDNPVGGRAKVELTTEGRLVLTDQSGNEVWSKAPGNVRSAAMLDTGNFVLMGSDSVNRWQSFDDPTDTILPTQVIAQSGMLSSRQSDTNFSLGRFQMRLLPDGNLVLNTIALPTNYAYERYWISNNTYLTTDQVVFDQSSGVRVVPVDGKSYLWNVTSANIDSPQDFYQRATLGPDGIFRHFTYPRNSNPENGSWSVAAFIPENICTSDVPLDKGGSGTCGFNSYCRPNGDGYSCECPPGYSYLDPSDPGRGCKPDFVGWNCESDGTTQAEALFDMNELENIAWPNYDAEVLQPIGEDRCRSFCLEDCLCAMVIYGDNTCRKKKFPFSNGRMEPSYGDKMLIKIPKFNSSSQRPDSSGSKRRDQSTPIVIVSVLLGSSVFVNFLLLTAISLVFLLHHRRLQRSRPEEARMAGISLRSFGYKEIEKATDGFKEELGRGSCAIVYKGALELASRTFVAVKKLDKVVREGEKEFFAEMNAIGRTHHKNLVQLLGFCNEGPHRILVYEFMSHGSLAGFLFGSVKPGWHQRLRIATGIARGLAYLHEECCAQIIHCDVKPQNILLDDMLVAKISDFGLAKLLNTNQSRTSTGIRGTKGYVAPEWFKSMPITAKVDVYSFGVLLLEIICCRRNVVVECSSGNNELQKILTEWAYECYRVGDVGVLVADDEEATSDERRLERLVAVAIWCIQEEPSLRPSMKKVTLMLEGTVDVAVPPDPTSFISSIDC